MRHQQHPQTRQQEALAGVITHRSRRSYRRNFRRGAFTALAAAAATAAIVALSACASSSDPAQSTAPKTATQKTAVSFALDWAPNTNHIGVYVAQSLGYYADAGLEVEILPYGSTSASQLVAAGEADFGIGGQSGVQMARTSGLDLVSVYQITQTDTGRLVFLDSRKDLKRPKDLDGRTFGGFGAPLYTALAKATITGDGGTGKFDEVALDSGAYEALSQGRIDFTLSVATWENLQAELDGHPYRAFRYQDFGVPEQQSTGIVSNSKFLDAHPDTARAFVQATARGYEYAVEHPDKAADILIAENPDTLGAAKQLVRESAKLMATDGYFSADGIALGAANPEHWNAFGKFLFTNKFLTDASGDVVTTEPDWSTYYTNTFLK